MYKCKVCHLVQLKFFYDLFVIQYICHKIMISKGSEINDLFILSFDKYLTSKLLHNTLDYLSLNILEMLKNKLSFLLVNFKKHSLVMFVF